ncbi:hypothetical protein MJ575_08610 [Klebsiella pneumoniae]|nr:hypothetical protein MJ575_08610 [Klebsiella pneumoniae]
MCHQLLRRRRPLVLVSALSPLLVDGFSFLAITRQIAAIYRAWQRGKPLLSRLSPPSPRWWTSTSYAGSEAWQRDSLAGPAPRYRRLPHSLPPLGGRAAGSDGARG